MKRDLRDRILRTVYEVPLKYYKNKLKDIIERNNLINGSRAMYGNIIYKNLIYKSEPSYYPGYVSTKTYDLHLSLYDEMEEYIYGFNEIDEEVKTLTRSVTILINFCNHPEDLKFLLGSNLYGHVSNFSFALTKEPKKETELLAFQLQYDKYLNQLNERFVSNIVMSGVYNDS